MDVSTLNVSAFVFQSAPNGAFSSYQLTSGAVVTKSNDVVVILQLSITDSNNIRNITTLATSSNTTYLSVSSYAIKDMASNSLVTVQLQVTNYIDDTINPYLVSFRLDLNTGVLYLTFDETVNVLTFNPSGISLQNSAVNATVVFNLTGGSIQMYNSTVVALTLLPTDLNSVKFFTSLGLGTSANGTFLSLVGGSIRDIYGNPVSPAALQMATSVQSDVSQPALWYFTFDANTGYLRLTFSETVNVNTFYPPALTLQSSSNRTITTITYTLTSGAVLTANSTVVVLALPSADRNAIKALSPLASSVATTYLSHTSSLVKDMSGNVVTAVLPSVALLASNFTPDTTPVSLVNFTIDLNQGTLTLNFNETVNYNTFVVSQFTLLSANASLQLAGTASPPLNTTTIVITLSFDALNSLKSLPLCTPGSQNCYLNFTSSAVQDMSGNGLYVPSIPVAPAGYVPDTTPPTVVSFTQYSYPLQSITITFSEIVNISTFDATGITLQTFFTILPGESYLQLTGGILNQSSSHIITITLLTPDLNYIAVQPTLCYRRNTCWLSLANITVNDFSNNPVVAVPNDTALYPLSFIADKQNVSLQYFDFSLQYGNMTMYFSKPVSVNLLNPTVLSFLGQPGAPLQSTLTLTGGSTLSSNGLVIVLQFTAVDFLNMKASLSLLKDRNHTYVSFPSSFITDTTYLKNPINSISTSSAQQVRFFDPDTVSPLLISAYLDLTFNKLTLSFNEPVLSSTLLYSRVVVQSTLVSPVVRQPLQNTSLSSSSVDGSTSLTILVNPQDLLALKIYLRVVQSCFVVLQNGSLLDTSFNPNLYSVANITTSTTGSAAATSLTSFSLDMNTGLLYLTFNDVVNASTFVASGIIIQNALYRAPNYYYQLTLGSYTQSQDGYSIAVLLSNQDLNQIKVTPDLATQLADTWITCSAETLKDVNGINILATTNGNAIMVSQLTLDTTPPRLSNFTLDLNANVLYLTFNEAVNANTFVPGSVQLQNAIAPTLALQLNNATPSAALNSTVIAVYLISSDVNYLTVTGLATRVTNAFISLTNASIVDIAGNVAGATKNTSSVIQASAVIPDRTAPRLVASALDMNLGTLFLTFSETVNAATLDALQVTIQSQAVRTLITPTYTLTGGQTSVTNSTVVYIRLTLNDTNALEQVSGLATSDANTFIVITNLTVQDMSGNSNAPVPSSVGLDVSSFVSNAVPPTLQKFTLDLNSNTMVLYFSETVDISTLDLSQVTLQNETLSTVNYTLTGGTVMGNNAPQVVVYLTTADLNEVKKRTYLATRLENTFLYINYGTVADTFGNRNVALLSALPCSLYIGDATGPSVSSFSLDMNQGTLGLTFSETVRMATFNVTYITLLSSTAIPTDNYTLTGGSFATAPQPYLTINLTLSDLNELKRLHPLADLAAFTYMSTPAGIVLDMASNPAYPVVQLPVTTFIPDTTPPALNGFDLDMDGGNITLYFSETVQASSINMTQLTLLAGPNSLQSLTLQSGIVPSGDSSTITLQLNPNDLITLQTLIPLADSNATTFISITNRFLVDTNSNTITSIQRSNPLRVSQFTKDLTPPELVGFSVSFPTNFNVTTIMLSLTFSEAVNISSFDPTQITLLNSSSIVVNGSISYQLHGGTVLNSNTSWPVVDLLLTAQDANAIKALAQLLKSSATTYIAITPALIADMAGYPIVAVRNTSAVAVGAYSPDTQGPQFQFFNYDANTGLLTLGFDETVNAATLRFKMLTLQSSPTNMTAYYQLQRYVSLTALAPVIYVPLDPADLLNIKILLTLATSANTTFLQMNNLAIKDAALAPNVFNSPTVLQVTNYTADTVGPTLVSIVVDLANAVLDLRFNEPVDVTSLDASGLTAISGPNSTLKYTLTGGITRSSDDFLIEVSLTRADLNVIQNISGLWTNINNTYISIQPNFITDIAKNPVITIPTTDPLKALMYFNDSNRPYLINFDLDMNVGVLVLHFSKTVVVSSLNFTAIILQEIPNTIFTFNAHRYRLTGGKIISLGNVPDVFIQMSFKDFTGIQAAEIAYSKDSSYLVFGDGAILDTYGNPSLPHYDGINPANVNIYIRDMVGPELLSFTLNLTSNDLILSFDDSVLISTFNVSEVTLLGSSFSVNYTLTSSSSVTTQLNNPVVDILLSVFDLEQHKEIVPHG
ncbi:hypothetical protein EMCRGX_G018703 [Ephydatia muelleri]